ncbi:uncharacterized protein LOC129789475 [Lutzomyia longipalpis]|uniref:uncharacterized protein LOC129789475 n=1 Tax=Lutzomyia longipalpis TaxID=7200 RepID=UPI002483EA58|nr:uncharacterized protein LOC129789475 [Lutzomyia longipalpis]
MNLKVASVLFLFCVGAKRLVSSQSFKEICNDILHLKETCLLYCIFDVYDHHGDEHITANVIFNFLVGHGFTANSPNANVTRLEACLRFLQDSLNTCGVRLPIYQCIRDNLSQDDLEIFMQYIEWEITPNKAQLVNPKNWGMYGIALLFLSLINILLRFN